MDFKDQLPKPGKKIKNGKFIKLQIIQQKGFTLFSARPDYQKFKSKVFNTESDCVSAVVGFIAINTLCKLARERMDFLSIQLKKDSNKEPEEKYRYELVEFQYFFDEIQKLLEIGGVTKEIGTVLEGDIAFEAELAKEYNTEVLFSREVYYHSLSFLNWMKRNGFRIPDELSFHKNEFGNLEYDDPVAFDKIEKPPGRATIDPNKKWVDKCIAFCRDNKKKNGQYPIKNDVECFLEKALKENNVMVGKHVYLSESAFLKIWKQVPNKMKRPRGEKTKK